MQNPVVDQPQGLKVKLYPHQLTSIFHMEKLEAEKEFQINGNFVHTKMAIFGDMPGYGKSYSIIGLLLRDKMQWDTTQTEETSYISTESNNDTYRIYKKYSTPRIKTNLILAGASIFSQWREYLEKCNLKVGLVLSTKCINNKLIVSEYDVILCIPSAYNALMSHVGNVCWKRFIYDEPPSSYITSMKDIKAGFIWLVCATYTDIYYEYSTGSRRSHFMRSMLGPLTLSQIEFFVIKNSKEYILSSFNAPSVNNVIHKIQPSRLARAVSNHVPQHIKIMIDAGDIHGAMNALGAHSGDKNIMEVVGRKKRREIEEAKFKCVFYADDEYLRTIWQSKLEVLEKDYEDIKKKYDEITHEDCSICADKLDNPILVPCCQQIFCGKCILNWIATKKTCPYCRSVNDPKDLIRIATDEPSCEASCSSSPPNPVEEILPRQNVVANLIKNLSANPTSRILLFSCHDSSFDIIKDFLKGSNISFRECKGSVATRTNIIKKYKSGDNKLLFLNSNYNGAGINLEETTDIIIYHDMEQNLIEQIIGRAMRIGREIPLTVHKLVEFQS